jgi:hypothetical protein
MAMSFQMGKVKAVFNKSSFQGKENRGGSGKVESKVQTF